MTDYQTQAREFLNECNAEMSITFNGFARPNWDKKDHACYTVIIKTRRGNMTVIFYDSLHNTELLKINPHTLEEKRKQDKARPTEYDILSCLQKYDVGTMDDFMTDFGYEIKNSKDLTDFITTYNAVLKEWQDVSRCFTPDQIEKMQEIQ